MNESLRENCYKILRQVPKGRVTTYKILAEKLGVKSYRLIGRFMANNPDIPATPCHRVVRSDGFISGYALGVDKKYQILAEEGIKIEDGKIVDFEKVIYKF